MRALRTLTSAAVLTVSLAAFPASAQATTTYEYSVSGAEVSATSTKGRFVGTASGGGAVGTWYAEVNHTRLVPHGNITSGPFGMTLSRAPGIVGGQFEPHDPKNEYFDITQINPGNGCRDQVYTVDGRLDLSGTGTGTFNVTLTHRRVSILRRCTTYAATVSGKVRLTV
jgi:hypothetical protein